MMEHLGGKKSMQQLWENEKFVHHMLQLVEPWAVMKPVDKPCATKRSKDATARGKQRCYELLARDMLDPSSASKRSTRRFKHILEARDAARKGYASVTRTLRGH